MSPRSSALVRLFVGGAAWLARLAPARLRADLQSDGLFVLADVCERARREGGQTALLRVGLAEWFNLIVTAWRTRTTAGLKTGRSKTGGSKTGRSNRPGLGRDLVDAARSLRLGRGTATLAVVTLALGIGVNTAVFSILDSLLFRPVPYAEADRLVGVWSYYAPGKFQIKGQFTAPLVAEWRKQTDLFDRVEATEEKSFIYDTGRGAEMISGSVVTPGLFSMLGVPPQLGRVFHDGDGREGTSHLVIVSQRFWQQRLARDLNAIGRTITIDDERFEVVGVMPATFRYPDESQDLWIPLDVTQPPAAALRARTNLSVTARMREGVTRADVDSRVAARGEAVYRASGGSDEAGARVVTLGELFNDRTARSLWVLGGAVVFLLLIVCANVANLTLARSMARTRDLAVRAALGATRGALFRVTLLEHAILGVAGALLGLGVAQLAIVAVTGALPEEMTQASLNAIDLDWRTLAFLAACSMSTILIFGLPPAIVASRATVAAALGRESRASTGSPSARRFRAALVVLEVAFSIVLLVGAALMTRSLVKLQSIDVGMNPQDLLALRVGFPARGFEDARAIELVTTDIVARLAATPGVQHASAGSLPPNESMITVGAIEFGDRPGERTKRLLTRVYETWPGYFAAAGIPLIEGREPVERDVEGAVVVSREFAAKHWPGRTAIGARFRVGDHPWRTVIGVSAELRRLGETPESAQQELFYPHDQVSGVFHAAAHASAVKVYRTFIVRTTEPGALARRLGEVVHEADPRVILTSTTLVAHQFANLIARPRIVFLMLAIFAGAGLLLAAAGLYAVLAHLVTQRLREIGVRLAIGARPADVARLVLRSGALFTGTGLILGLAGAAALVGVMRTLLYEVDPIDPLAMGLAVTLLAGTTLVASFVPARRAMRVDPVQLLRES